ncbi:MAG: type II and III secretion system protein [Verrucomicrobiales bacterium]|nr:type II and III secretion system protein [Verrucomicrobiales bacterium]
MTPRPYSGFDVGSPLIFESVVSNLRKIFITMAVGVFKKAGLILALGIFASGQNLYADGIGVDGASASVPQIATNYVIRMQEQVKRADDAALRGSQLMADGDYEGAVEQYNNAIDLLPDAPMTAQRRRAYVKQYARAATTLARSYADAGRYNDAMGLIEDVLRPTVSPDNLDAKRLLEQLNDPEYYSPALTPQHLERVRKVKMALKTGKGYLDYGDYDRAEREYHKALNIDRYNSAARRSLEEVERHRMNYYDVARDQTRSTFIRQVSEEWELPVPTAIDIPDIAIGGGGATQEILRNEEKLKTIRIPSLEFSDTPLKDALQFIQQKSVELDFAETDVNRKGVNIILSADVGGGGGAAPAPAAGGGDGFGFEGGGGGGAALGGGGVGGTPITLRLTNVPLGEALRYTTNLAQLKYKVESHAVVVVPLSTPDADLFTNQYTVPPTFLSGGGGNGGGGAAAAADPFAPEPAAGAGGPAARLTAKQILENAGITFAQGSTAIYNPGTSTLIVKNTPDQMDLVEAYINSIKTGVEKQIYITSKFIEIAEDVGKELGFDWLLGGFNIGSTPRVFAGGGTGGFLPSGTSTINSGSFAFQNPGTTNPVGTIGGNAGLLTSGLRSGTNAISTNSIDALIASTAGTSQATGAAPTVFGISGVFTDPQFQMMIRALNQKKGVDLLSAPSVMARSGNRAKIEVIREFIYPTEYDPPEIPNQFGGGGGTGTTIITSFPVTPATPTAFEVRNTGVTLEVDPVLGADNYTIDLNLSPEVVEFDGFINYGSPINTTSITGTTVTLTANRILMPVFNTRKVTTQVTIWDGQTVALGGLIREDIQDVEDKIPFIGDLPAIGRLFRTSAELHLKRNLTIFVKAVIQDPAGQPIHGTLEEEQPNIIEPRPRVTSPPAASFAPPPIDYIK